MTYRTLHFPPLRRRSNYSTFSSYKAFRQEIREDCQGRCVYCDVHENEVGGERHMTLDHFRPKDKYEDLKNDPTNLVWACKACNDFKRNIWPAYLTPHTFVGECGFLDPFKESMWNYFDVLHSGELSARMHPAQWLTETLHLNRTVAKRIREYRNLKYERKQMFESFFNSAIKEVETLLKSNRLSEEEKVPWRIHKEKLEQNYKISIDSCEMDLSLYIS